MFFVELSDEAFCATKSALEASISAENVSSMHREALLYARAQLMGGVPMEEPLPRLIAKLTREWELTSRDVGGGGKVSLTFEISLPLDEGVALSRAIGSWRQNAKWANDGT